tara:strand:- start:1806 stop:1994 length:189 start_codon:yes stop_codon:yes gene_type:complete
MEEISIKVTWEGLMYEWARIMLNPHASLTAKGEQDMMKQLLHVARMADKWVAHVQRNQGGEE